MSHFIDLSSTWLQRRPPSGSSRLSFLNITLVSMAIIMAALLGIALPAIGREILLGPLLLFGGLLLLIHPILGLLLITATIPLENLAVFEGEVTITRLLGIGVLGAWFARKLLRHESWQVILSSNLIKLMIVILGLAVASALWAAYPSEALSGSSQLFRLFLLIVLVSDLANSWQRVTWLVRGSVVAGFGAAILTMQQYLAGNVSSSGRAGEGIAGGINATALVLVTLIPFAFYLIRARAGHPWRLLGMLYVAVATFAVAATFSRASLIVLLFVISAEVWQTLKSPSGRGWVILALGSILVAALAVSPRSELDEQLVTRAQSVVPLIRSTLAEDDSGVLSDRGFHAKVGLAIFLDHQLLGAGYENYGHLFLHDYQFRVSGADRIWGSPRSPHGTYIGLLANLGLLGITLWLGVIAIALYDLVRARSIMSGGKHSDNLRLVETSIYGLLLLSAYGFSTDVHEAKILWLILGMSVAIKRLADQRIQKPNSLTTSGSSIQV